MNRREFLGRLINYYAIAKITGEHYGLLLPYNYHSEYVSTIVSLPENCANHAIAIYDDNTGDCVFANCVKDYKNGYTYSSSITGGYNYQLPYTTTTNGRVKINYNIPICKPGNYTSKIIYISPRYLADYTEVSFTIDSNVLESRKNYGKEDSKGIIKIDHGIYYSAYSNKYGTFYGDIPSSCLYTVSNDTVSL